MASRRQRNSGLDLSGVGSRHMKLPGGDMKSRSGLQISGSASSRGGQRAGGSASRRHHGGTYVHNDAGAGESRSSRKTLLVVIAIVVGALLLAVVVGLAVYQQAVKNAVKPSLDEGALASSLSAAGSAESATWNVLVKTDATSAETGRGAVRDIALVYLDPDNKTMTFLWLDTNTRVYLDGYGYQTLAGAFSLQGETGLVVSIAKLGDVKVSHYVEFNDAGLRRFAERLAPLEADVATAGREDVTAAVCKKMLGSGSEQISEAAGDLTNCAGTDLNAETAGELFGALQGIDVSSGIRQADEPAKAGGEGGSAYADVDTDEWTSMIARVETGLSPVASKKELGEYESMRSNSVVDIWNGVGVSGIANDCSKELRKLGWNIGETGNAAQFVYKETLVVYNTSRNRELAELVVSDLGQGRVVMGAARYNFTGDVLVVLGSDYRPY